ncbi:MAG: ABC transporter ATP-binding protein, partial [Kofleriaceae bacterium]
MTHAIELTGLTKTFDQVQAVSDLTLRVEPGQVLGFLGPNGAGKTTTIKAICGLIKPTAGEIRLNGFDVARQRRQAMRQFGAVLEGSRSVYWRMSAWDNLLYFGRLKGASGSQLKERAETMLRELELWDRKDDLVGSFSRGMQQKVSIACALAADPPIVLLDEPTLGLDLDASRVVKAWVQRLVREHGKTV